MMIEKDFKYLLFVGSGRTGSTVVGQLLNSHPNFLVSSELKILRDCVKNRKKVRDNLPALIERASYEFEQDLENSEFSSSNFKEKWQKDWSNISAVARELKLEKEKIRYIGDKKQGGNAKLFQSKRKACLKALEGLDWIPVSVLRSPSPILLSIRRRSKNFEDTCNKYVSTTLTAIDLVQERNGVFVIYDLLTRDPYEYSKVIECSFNLETNPTWRSLVERIIKGKPSLSPTVEEVGILEKVKRWPELKEKYQALKMEDPLL